MKINPFEAHPEQERQHPTATGYVPLSQIVLWIEEVLVENKKFFNDGTRETETYIALENTLRNLNHYILDLPRKNNVNTK